MNKQQQIEEIAQIINGSTELDTIAYYRCMNIAKTIYNAGYQKIPEDSVVLSREEQEKILTATEKRIKELKKQILQARKETAEKYNDGVVEFIKNIFDIGQIDFKTKIELLKENEKILKQFAVEIKEL